MNLMVQQGWQCPCCSKVYSPTTSMCFYCPPKVTVASNLTPKRTWVGLTDEEIKIIKTSAPCNDTANCGEAITFGRAIEAKLKEKNFQKGESD